jgi:hypothetical protein
MAFAGTSSILLQSQLMRPLSRQSATEAITKIIPTFIIMKTKQATIFIKNLNCFIYRLILAIVRTMVKVHQSSIPPPWVGVTLKTQLISEVDGLDPPAPTRGICSHKEAEAEQSNQDLAMQIL